MDTELRAIDRAAPPSPIDNRFSLRVVDQFFRRWPLYVLPFLLFVAVGVLTALGAEEEYRSFATVSASSNPLVESTPVRGNTIDQFETPAQGTARLISERLATDVFVDDVATRAGLLEAIEAGLIDRDVMRSQIFAGVRGNNVLEVNAVWTDPDTALLLVDSTVNAYLDYVLEVVSADSVEAIELLTEIRSSTEVRVAAAETDLDAYLQANPGPLDPEAERPIDQQLTIQRLNDALIAANSAFQDIDDQISAAELTAQRARSDAGRQIRILDAPQAPFAPEPMRMDQLVTMLMFTILGAVVCGTALLIVTAMDGSLRLRSQLEEATRSDAIAVIPKLKSRDRTDEETHEERSAS